MGVPGAMEESEEEEEVSTYQMHLETHRLLRQVGPRSNTKGP